MTFLEWMKKECNEWEKEINRFNQSMDELHFKILKFFGRGGKI